MTQEEMRHLVDALSYNVRPHIHTSSDERRAAEYMEERSWIKKMFEDAVFASSQESDRHPRHVHYMGHWIEPRDECSRAVRRRARTAVENEPAELTAGDTSQLDAFLGGFANAQK